MALPRVASSSASLPAILRRMTLLVFVVATVLTIGAEAQSPSLTKTLNTILGKNYDKRRRPNAGGDPVQVKVGLFIERMDADDKKMTTSATTYLRMSWNDRRLKHNMDRIVLANDDTDPIWKPDYYFSNEKRTYGMKAQAADRYVRISSNGDVFYSERVTLDLTCFMKFNKLPFDEQRCNMQLESYGHTTKDIMFSWLENPVDISEYNFLKIYHLRGRAKATQCDQKYVTGTFTCLKAQFTLTRDVGGFYMNLIYIPTLFLVVLAFLAMYYGREHVAARAGTGIFSLLGILFVYAASRDVVPPVSYITPLDAWLVICALTALLPLVTFAVVSVIARDGGGRALPILKQKLYCGKDPADIAETVEKVARMIILAFFSTFNVLYWLSFGQ